MNEEPRESLSSALFDPSPWVRIGAAAIAPWLAPTQAADLLMTRAWGPNEELPLDEAATIAVALARAGGDPLPLVARLLRDDVVSLKLALEGDYDRWANYLFERADSVSLPSGPPRLLLPFYASWRSRGNIWHAPPRTEEGCARSALYVLKSTLSHYSGGMTATEQQSVLATTFGEAKEQLSAGHATAAVGPLIEIAVTASSRLLRDVAQEALAALGSNASAPLLELLAGGAGPRPNVDVFESIRNEGGFYSLEDVTSETLAAFFAGESLELFSDETTAFAIIRAAIAWKSQAQARVARVAARMSAHVALPRLLWSAVNLPSASDRRVANTLLDRIIARDDAFGIWFPHIGPTEIDPVNLNWLRELASSQPTERIWISDPSVAIRILSSAIASIPDIAGPVGRMYADPKTKDRVFSFTRSISSLQQLFGTYTHLYATEEPRYPQIGFPGHCRLGDETTMRVRLLPEEEDAAAAPVVVPFADGQETTKLLVLVRARGFNVSPDYAELQVPRKGQSDTATFCLRAREKGEQAIEVKFLSGTAEIGHCCVVSRVTTDVSGGEAATTVLTRITDESLQLQSDAQAYLRVKTQGTRLEWTFIKADAQPESLGHSPASFGPQEISQWCTTQAPLIRRMLENDLSADDLAGVLARLAAIGHKLFAQIAPPLLSTKLAELRDDSIVVVDSDADWIPWELLASDPRGELWGERYVLARAPVVAAPPNAVISPPGMISSTLNHALLVVGDNIAQPQNLARRTFGEMEKRAVPLIESTWLRLCSEVEGKDIVHFACHGRSDPNYYLSYGSGVGRRLEPNQVHALGLKWGATVFANACRSGTAELLLADFQSFGREFYYAGARPFIGTLGPVPEREAIDFAALFYRQFAFAGLPAGQAMRQARREAAKQFKKPIWLFYCLYGNPSVTKVWSAV